MKVLGVIGALVAIIGGVLGILAYFKDPGTPDENQAQLFIEACYATAPSDTSLAWAMTTDSYRDQGLVGGYANYKNYWHTMRSVTVDDFGISQDPQRSSWWKARITFTDQVGKVTRPYFQYQLECTWQSNLPWNRCDREHIVLNKARHYDLRDYLQH